MSKEKQIKCAPVRLTADDVIEGAAKSLSDLIFEARKRAIAEGIIANTVIIDKSFAKVNSIHVVAGDGIFTLPPMICGLEVKLSDELPDRYDFAILEAPETEREKLIRKTKNEVIDDIVKKLHTMLPFKALSLINGEPIGNSFELGKEKAIFELIKYLGELRN